MSRDNPERTGRGTTTEVDQPGETELVGVPAWRRHQGRAGSEGWLELQDSAHDFGGLSLSEAFAGSETARCDKTSLPSFPPKFQ